MKNALVLLLCLSLGTASGYIVKIDQFGSANVEVIVGKGLKQVMAIPEDAIDFKISGGYFSRNNNTVVISSDTNETANFAFTTYSLTSRTPTGWMFRASPPDNSDIKIYLPQNAILDAFSPDTSIVNSENSKMVVVNSHVQNITVYYHLQNLSEQTISFEPYLLFATILALVAFVFLFVTRCNKQTVISNNVPVLDQIQQFHLPDLPHLNGFRVAAPSLGLTKGKMDMMETFNENDLAIVNYLLANEGKSKRNILERKTNTSKSSLAVALNRLEKRKIIDIDRTSTTHFIKLSEYFLKM